MITKYKALLAAIDAGTIAKAAQQLGYTVSGISRMISSVEDELGMTLLIRGKNGVTPTDECRELIPYMQELVLSANRLYQSADEMKGLVRGEITVGTSMEAYIPVLAKLVGEFTDVYPGIHVNILEDYSSPLARMLEAGEIDFCIMSKRAGNFQWQSIHNDPLVVLVHPEHRFASMKEVPVDLLSEETFIDVQTSIDTDNSIMLRTRDITLTRTLSCSNNFAAASMIEAGLGIAIENAVNTSVWNKSIKTVPLVPAQYVEIGVGTPAREKLSPAAARFIEFAKERL